MALQSSGQIKLSEIASEVGASSTNISLRAVSSTASKSTQDAISEFYSYSHSSTFSFTASTKQTSIFSVCSTNSSMTLYHNNASGGSSSTPAINDYVYTNSAGTTKTQSGYYKFNSQTYDWFRVNGFGRIYQTGNCL